MRWKVYLAIGGAAQNMSIADMMAAVRMKSRDFRVVEYGILTRFSPGKCVEHLPQQTHARKEYVSSSSKAVAKQRF